ncbi:MAG: 3-keto-5-aminohexanoate cleavage protein, partial [Dehalococcoidales bacterium]|nr:3-keto-5-aminohexanoate cleavage protein [Dehalococcoidales bacterium]
PTNSDLVRRVREQAESMGRQIASPDDARQMLGVG